MAPVMKKRKMITETNGLSCVDERVKVLEKQLAEERATRYRLAAQHGLNPNPDKSLLDVLPLDIVTMILDLLLIKPYYLHLNHLLTKPEADNIAYPDGYSLGVRRAVGGTSWHELENDPDRRVLEGKFEFDLMRDQWRWCATSGYAEIWRVINTCKAFRSIGLPILFGKNKWILSPVWGVTKARVQREWCVRTAKYQGPWTGVDHFPHDGVPLSLSDDFKLSHSIFHAAGDHIISSDTLIRELGRRDLRDQEYICMPKGLLGMPNPLQHIKHIGIGFLIKAHVATDAAHFLKETIQFISKYREFGNLEHVELIPSFGSFRTAFEHDWGCKDVKKPVLKAVKQVLQANAIWCKTSITIADEPMIDEMTLTKVLDAAVKADKPGTRQLYPKVELAKTKANDQVVLLRNGQVRAVTWPRDAFDTDSEELEYESD